MTLKKKKEIETLKAQEDNGEIDLYFYVGAYGNPNKPVGFAIPRWHVINLDVSTSCE